jgi:hypothetical protein
MSTLKQNNKNQKEVFMSQDESNSPGVKGNHESDLWDKIKVAIIRMEEALKEGKLPVHIIYSSLLNGLAVICGSHVELIRQLLSLKNEEDGSRMERFIYKQEVIFSWYLSAKFPSQEIFSWFGEAGSKDDEIANSLIMSMSWNGTDFDGLSDEDIINYILASGWDQSRQMAAMVNNNIITSSTIRFLSNFYGSIDVVIELIGKGGKLNKDTFRVIQTILVPSKNDPKKMVMQWTKRKIWYFWDELKISDEQKASLFYQALGPDGLVAFLRSLSVEDKEIITYLQMFGLSLGKIADIYAPKVMPRSCMEDKGKQSQEVSIDAKRVSPEFMAVVSDQGKTDQEIVQLLVDYEFTFHIIATSLISAGWETSKILTSLLEAGCNIILISRMVEAAAQDFEEGNNIVWGPEVIVIWRKLLKDKMEELANRQLFGQLP